MKIIHLADLHIGKSVCGRSMLDDQQFILNQIAEKIEAEKPGAVLISGDFYDTKIPSAEALQLGEEFLSRLTGWEGHPNIFIISGNHDSADRLAYLREFLIASGIYFSPIYDGSVKPVVLQDEYGEINFYPVPFLRPDTVRKFFPDAVIESFSDALQTVVESLKIDTSKRNIILAHQYVSGGKYTDSENRPIIGTCEDVAAEIFEPFDYAALGHLHRPQQAGRKDLHIYYPGSPLKYSKSEAGYGKVILKAEFGAKGDEIAVTEIPLTPKRDLRVIKGLIDELVMNEPSEDYIYADIEDTNAVPDAEERLLRIFPNFLSASYNIGPNRIPPANEAAAKAAFESPIEVFSKFFTEVLGIEMTDDQTDYISELIKSIWNENGGEE